MHSPDYVAFHAPTRENLFMDGLDEYIETVNTNYSYDPKLADLYLLGQFVVLGDGLVYTGYAENRGSIDVVAPSRVLDTIHFGVDFNVGACVAVIGGYFDDEFIIFDEVVGSDTENLCHRIRAKYPDARWIAYPDATGKNRSTNAAKTDLQLIRDEGIHVQAKNANPRVTDRVNTVNAAFHKGFVKLVPSRVPLLHHALMAHAYKDGEPEKFKEHPKGKGSVDDATDALGYMLYNLFPLSKPIYATGIGIR